MSYHYSNAFLDHSGENGGIPYGRNNPLNQTAGTQNTAQYSFTQPVMSSTRGEGSMFFGPMGERPFLTREVIERAKEEIRMMEDTLRLQEAANTKCPSSGLASEVGEPTQANVTTRESTGLPPEVLKEMGVLLYPRWQDWSTTFDQDDTVGRKCGTRSWPNLR